MKQNPLQSSSSPSELDPGFLWSSTEVLAAIGFGLWLAAFLFARVPLAALERLTGYDFQPYLLINVLALGLALLAGWRHAARGLACCRLPGVLPAVAAFAVFWAIYLLRLGIDQWWLDLPLVRSAPRLLRECAGSTLVPALLLPWLLPQRLILRLFDWVAVAGNVAIASGLVVYWLWPDMGAWGGHRFAFADLNPIPAGHSAASLLLIGGSLLLLRLGHWHKRSTRLWRLNALFALLIGLIGVFASSTRSALVALVPLVLVLILQTRHRLRQPHIWVGLPLAALGGAFTLRFSLLGQRLLQSGQEASSSERFTIAVEGLRLFWQNPFLGSGFRAQLVLSALPTSRHHWYPHNLPVEAFMIGGATLAIPFGLFLWYCSRPALAELLQPTPRLVFALLWFQGCLYALFSGHLGSVPLFWLAGLMLVLSVNSVVDEPRHG